jgi:hypothetical protein
MIAVALVAADAVREVADDKVLTHDGAILENQK